MSFTGRRMPKMKVVDGQKEKNKCWGNNGDINGNMEEKFQPQIYITSYNKKQCKKREVREKKRNSVEGKQSNRRQEAEAEEEVKGSGEGKGRGKEEKAEEATKRKGKTEESEKGTTEVKEEVKGKNSPASSKEYDPPRSEGLKCPVAD